MLRVALINPGRGKALHTEELYGKFEPTETIREVLIVANPYQAHGQFKAVSRVTAGTTTIVAPPSSGSIVLTDIMISATKVQSSTAELLFDDDTNTETIFKADMTNGEMFYSHAVNGRIQGWRDARLDLTTVNGSDVYVTVGYVRIEEGLTYSEWNTSR